MQGVRLSKLMSERGLCSRREADAWIERGLVSVDGRIISILGTRVDPDCEITVLPQALAQQRALVTVLLNKPVGYVSGQPEGQYPTASSLVIRANRYAYDRCGIHFRANHRHNLAPAGRLDIDSRGLLVLTQDGRIASRLIAPESNVDKEYRIRFKGCTDESILRRLRHGLHLDGRELKPAVIRSVKPDSFTMILNEGRKRQIRRMCELVGLQVTGLKRVRIGNVRLGNLPVGQWRYLAADESF